MLGQAARLHVEQRAERGVEIQTLIRCAASARTIAAGSLPVHGEGDDAAALARRGRARSRRASRASRARSAPASARTRAQIASSPQPQRVVHRDAQADLAREVASPSSRSGGRRGASCSGRRATQVGGVQVEEGRLQPLEHARGARRGSRCRAARAGTCARSPTACRSRSPPRRSASARPTGRRPAGRARRPRAPPGPRPPPG